MTRRVVVPPYEARACLRQKERYKMVAQDLLVLGHSRCFGSLVGSQACCVACLNGSKNQRITWIKRGFRSGRADGMHSCKVMCESHVETYGTAITSMRANIFVHRQPMESPFCLHMRKITGFRSEMLGAPHSPKKKREWVATRTFDASSHQ